MGASGATDHHKHRFDQRSDPRSGGASSVAPALRPGRARNQAAADCRGERAGPGFNVAQKAGINPAKCKAMKHFLIDVGSGGRTHLLRLSRAAHTIQTSERNTPQNVALLEKSCVGANALRKRADGFAGASPAVWAA